MGASRVERDAFGTVQVPADRLWGAQTQRCLERFKISRERMPQELLHALTHIKRSCAEVNRELGMLDDARARAIIAAADEVLDGRHDAEFPLSVWQTGSGTHTNMNMNEVLANRASELSGGQRGEARKVHPNDHVNLGQSSNDVFASAMHIAAILGIEGRLQAAVTGLRDTLAAKAQAYASIVKIGRTHLQDAVPLTLGQEFSGYAAQLEAALLRINAALPGLRELAIGGTAVGTGLNTHPEFGERVAGLLTKALGTRLVSAPNKFAALASCDALVFAHGSLKSLAASLMKIADDIRWLASGPRCGIGEIHVPANEPGSSIMPGKVNPSQAEAMTMLCCQVLGNDVAVNTGGAMGNFELNVFRPMIAYNFLQSVRLLADGCDSFRRHCIEGIEPNRDRIEELLGRSLMLATVLTPHIGYDRAAAIAIKAHREDSSLKDAAIALGYVTAQQFEDWVRPKEMVGTSRKDKR